MERLMTDFVYRSLMNIKIEMVKRLYKIELERKTR